MPPDFVQYILCYTVMITLSYMRFSVCLVRALTPVLNTCCAIESLYIASVSYVVYNTWCSGAARWMKPSEMILMVVATFNNNQYKYIPMQRNATTI